MRSTPVVIWTAQALPATGVVTSPQPTLLDQVFGYAIQIVWAGTPTGAFKLQGSCDKGYMEPNGVITGVSNWTDLTDLTALAAGSAASAILTDATCMYRWVQIVYTASSGTGMASAVISIKGI